MTDGKKHIFVIGSKGIPASYGGFETFVEKLTAFKKSEELVYHVACMGGKEERFTHNGADCFRVKVPNIGPGKAVYYDIAALNASIRYVKEHPEIEHPIFYVLACRVGPFIKNLKKEIREVGGLLFINPDGNEWKRSKWSWPIRRYWRLSERLMVKHADLLICDSVSIRHYIKKEYRRYKPKTVFISYGSETRKSSLADNDPAFTSWLEERGLEAGEYYLIVGRFVPENNFEVMLREYMASGSAKKLAIITTENKKLMKELEEKLHFKADPRIVFAASHEDQGKRVCLHSRPRGGRHQPEPPRGTRQHAAEPALRRRLQPGSGRGGRALLDKDAGIARLVRRLRGEPLCGGDRGL